MANYNRKNKNYNSIKRQRSLLRKPWFYIVIVLAVAAVVFCVWFFVIRPNNNSVDQSNSSSGAVPGNTDAKGSNAQKDAEKKAVEEPNPQTPAQYEGENPNTLDEITGFISYAAVNGSNFSLRLTLNQYLTSGTCDLTMTSNGKTATASAPIFADASTSTCQGFDIPLSDLGSGDWSISIKISADDKTGVITGDYSL